MSVKVWVRYFLSELKTLNKSPHTIRTYGYDLEQFMIYVRNQKIPYLMDTRLFKQTCLTYLDSLHTYINEHQDKEEQYDEASINRKRSCMRSFVRFLSRRKYIDQDFSREIAFKRTLPPSDQAILSQQEIKHIINIHDQRISYGKTEDLRFMHHRNKLAFLTLLYTGMKVWELLSLKWGNLHIEESCIVVAKRTGIENRTIPISKSLLMEFISYLDRIKSLEHYNESFLSGYIFFGAGKTAVYAINPKTIERMIDSIAEEACITNKHITSKSLRHTMANYQLEKHSDIAKLTPMLGYSRKTVTRQMYVYAPIKAKRLKKSH